MSEKLYKPNGCGHSASYHKAPQDSDGWISAADYTPIPFDILELQLEAKEERTGLPKIVPGWHTGVTNCYDGRLLKRTDKVIKWRRIRSDQQWIDNRKKEEKKACLT